MVDDFSLPVTVHKPPGLRLFVSGWRFWAAKSNGYPPEPLGAEFPGTWTWTKDPRGTMEKTFTEYLVLMVFNCVFNCV